MYMYAEVVGCICTRTFYLTKFILCILQLSHQIWLFLKLFSYHVNSITLYEKYFLSKWCTTPSIQRVYWLLNAAFLQLHSVAFGNLYLRPRTSSASHRLTLDCNYFKKFICHIWNINIWFIFSEPKISNDWEVSDTFSSGTLYASVQPTMKF